MHAHTYEPFVSTCGSFWGSEVRCKSFREREGKVRNITGMVHQYSSIPLVVLLNYDTVAILQSVVTFATWFQIWYRKFAAICEKLMLIPKTVLVYLAIPVCVFV